MQRALRTARIAQYAWQTSRRLRAIRTGRAPADNARLIARDTGEAGILFIKMAQFVSSRPELASEPELARELRALQDRVPEAADWSEDGPPDVPNIAGVVLCDGGPVAAASVARVYRGTLDGTDVAVKVVRPDARQQIERDLPLLLTVLYVAKALDVPGSANMLEIVRECAPMLLAELDLTLEAAAQRRLRRCLGPLAWVRVPRVLASAPDWLVAEYVPSRRITDAVPTPALARRLFSMYVHMVLDAGLVHADPHPGNIGVQPSGTLVLYDCGAVVDISDARSQVAAVLRALVAQDVEAALRALTDMGVIRDDGTSASRLRRAAPTLRRLLREPGRLNEGLAGLPEFSSNSARVFELTTRYIYLVRSLVIVQGLIRYHDPGFEFEAYLQPYRDLVEDSVPAPWEVARDVAADFASVPASLRAMQDSMVGMNAAVSEAVVACMQVVTAGVLVTLLALLASRPL